jgi:hypothetical protein
VVIGGKPTGNLGRKNLGIIGYTCYVLFGLKALFQTCI